MQAINPVRPYKLATSDLKKKEIAGSFDKRPAGGATTRELVFCRCLVRPNWTIAVFHCVCVCVCVCVCPLTLLGHNE